LWDKTREGQYYDIYLTVLYYETNQSSDTSTWYLDYVENIPWRLTLRYFPYNEPPTYD